MSGVATSERIDGCVRVCRTPSKAVHRSGSSACRMSNRVSAATSVSPPGVEWTRWESTDSQCHSTSRSPKLSAVIWSSGEYFVLPLSPA